MKNSLVAFFVGLIFALGLGISGMTLPSKVQGFLDIFGEWDPSLLFVMAGAIGLHGILYPLIRSRKLPVFSSEWHVPTGREITPALVIGSFIFGIGWGLGGYCPGPAVVSLASLGSAPVVFLVFMLAGMLAFHFLNKSFPIKR